MATTSNLAIVLASPSHEMLTVDLQCDWKLPPGASPQSAAPEGPLRKSFMRKREEPLCKTLERIRLLTAPTPVKGMKTSMEEITRHAPMVRLLDADGAEIDDRMTNDAAWKLAATIAIGPEVKVPIRYNAPTVTAFSPPSSMYAGLPAVCSGVTVMFPTDDRLLYEWCVITTATTTTAAAAATSAATTTGAAAAASPVAQGQPLKVTSLLTAEATSNEPTTADIDRAREGNVVCREPCFVPQLDHVGRHVLVRIRPAVEGTMWAERVTPCVVKASGGGDGWFPWMPRWSLIPRLTAARQGSSTAFRVCTYNVLHDGFCTSNYALTKRYPYAPKEVLDIEYRRARIVQEWKQYDADVLCCQEVGSDVFKRYYKAVLHSMGWTARQALKGGSQAEGCMLAYRTSRFEERYYEDIALGWSAMQRVLPHVARDVEQHHPHLKEALEKLTTVAQIALLYDRTSGRSVLFTNTHLYYHGNACHIRILQYAILAHEAGRIRQQFSTSDSSSTPIEVVVCGDFNCTRNTGCYSLMSKGMCAPEHHSWGEGLRYWWGVDGDAEEEEEGSSQSTTTSEKDAHKGSKSGATRGSAKKSQRSTSPTSATSGDVAVPAAAEAQVTSSTTSVVSAFRRHGPPLTAYTTHLTSPLDLVDTHAHEPSLSFTNFALNFKEIIDHIFASRGLTLIGVLPAPSREECAQHVAIPSMMFPSDHIALVADLDFSTSRNTTTPPTRNGHFAGEEPVSED